MEAFLDSYSFIVLGLCGLIMAIMILWWEFSDRGARIVCCFLSPAMLWAAYRIIEGGLR